MKHITFADKSLLIGDEAADLMLEYAAKLAGSSNADTVKLNAISSDGDEVVATFLLDAGAPLMAETTTSTLPEPDNTDAVAYMIGQMALTSTRPFAVPVDGAPHDPTYLEFGV
jgi:hypothetical protein